MQTDGEIAQAARLKPIADVAADLGVQETALIPFGRYKAKIDFAYAATLSDRPKGKLILVTAMTPTRQGEGKTTVSIGLGDGLNRLGKKAVVCLREPSLGPLFGLKGGATGAGRAQVLPRDDINLHFTGDFHAIAAANNLLAAMVDNHLFRKEPPMLDPRRVTWRRTVDMNDRALREITVGLGGGANGCERSDGFDIVPASEVMAVLCLARDRTDLEGRLARMVVGYANDGHQVVAADLGAGGAMSALLRDALAPNLVQTIEANPVLVHGGPFANVAHGCNSVIATELALAVGDYVVTEAGFGADLGAEKFFNIKCRQAGLAPAAAVIVATVSSLKAHGGIARAALETEDVEAVRRGMPNLLRHIRIVRAFGLPAVVAINRYECDSEAELATIVDAVHEAGVTAVVSNHWSEGGQGAEVLAAEVAMLADAGGDVSAGPGAGASSDETGVSGFHLLYDDDMPLSGKLESVATTIYGASGITMDGPVRAQLDRLQSLGYGHLQICMAKTPYSLSGDPNLKGAPKDFTIPIRGLRLSAGAGYVVAVTGAILTMPGLPRHPAARDIQVSETGEIEGLR